MSDISMSLLYLLCALCITSTVHGLVCLRCVSFTEHGKCQQGGNLKSTQSCYGRNATCYARLLDFGSTPLFKRGCSRDDVCDGSNKTELYCSTCKFGICNSSPIYISTKKDVDNYLSPVRSNYLLRKNKDEQKLPPVLSNLSTDHSLLNNHNDVANNNLDRCICTCPHSIMGTSDNDNTKIQQGEYHDYKNESTLENTKTYSTTEKTSEIVTETSQDEVIVEFNQEVQKSEGNRNGGDGENNENTTTNEYNQVTGIEQQIYERKEQDKNDDANNEIDITTIMYDENVTVITTVNNNESVTESPAILNETIGLNK